MHVHFSIVGVIPRRGLIWFPPRCKACEASDPRKTGTKIQTIRLRIRSQDTPDSKSQNLFKTGGNLRPTIGGGHLNHGSAAKASALTPPPFPSLPRPRRTLFPTSPVPLVVLDPYPSPGCCAPRVQRSSLESSAQRDQRSNPALSARRSRPAVRAALYDSGTGCRVAPRRQRRFCARAAFSRPLQTGCREASRAVTAGLHEVTPPTVLEIHDLGVGRLARGRSDISRTS